MEVSTGDLAEILGVSERRIQQLAGAGVLRRQGHGEWVLPESVQAFLEYRLQNEIRKATKGSANGADRLKEIKARREELKLAQEERELVPLADAIAAMDEVAGEVSLAVNNVPARFTRDLSERERLEAEIHGALAAVAKRIRQRGAALRAARDVDPPPEEDDA